MAQSRVYFYNTVRFVSDNKLGLIFDLIGKEFEKYETNKHAWLSVLYKKWVDVIIMLPPGLKDISFNELEDYSDRIQLLENIVKKIINELNESTDDQNLIPDLKKILFVLKKDE